MNKFIEELMQVTTGYGVFDGDMPIFEIEELLEKHYGIKLDTSKWHGPRKAPPNNTMGRLYPHIYDQAILDSLKASNVFSLFKDG